MNTEAHTESELKTWITILCCLVIVFVQGLFAFFAVGNLGQPSWDYRPVKDVPGESPYAVYRLLPHPQHVRGAKGE